MVKKDDATTDAPTAPPEVDLETGEILRDTEAPMLNKARLNDVATTDEALSELFAEFGLTREDLFLKLDEYPLADKASLIEVPLTLVQWQFGVSQSFGSEYVQIKAVRMDTREKVSIFDAGTGIRDQLSEVTDRRLDKGKAAYNGLVVERGLTASSYGPRERDGETIPGGTTYYLAA